MARDEILVAAEPAAVFDVLADPRAYGGWVVGSREIRAADERWPATGTAFEHTIGMPPLTIDGETVVLESDPPRRLKLLIRARPLASATATVELTAVADGTRVTLAEDLANPLLNLAAGRLGHALLRLRNRESLRRLKELVERPELRPEGTLPHRLPEMERALASEA